MGEEGCRIGEEKQRNIGFTYSYSKVDVKSQSEIINPEGEETPEKNQITCIWIAHLNKKRDFGGIYSNHPYAMELFAHRGYHSLDDWLGLHLWKSQCSEPLESCA